MKKPWETCDHYTGWNGYEAAVMKYDRGIWSYEVFKRWVDEHCEQCPYFASGMACVYGEIDVENTNMEVNFKDEELLDAYQSLQEDYTILYEKECALKEHMLDLEEELHLLKENHALLIKNAHEEHMRAERLFVENSHLRALLSTHTNPEDSYRKDFGGESN